MLQKNIYIKLVCSLLLVNIIFWPCNALANGSLFVGILENFNKKEWSDAVGKDSINPRVRIAFFKDKDHWQAIKSDFNTVEQLAESTKYYPKQINWNVVNNKNILGNLTTTQYIPKLYRDVGVQEIAGDLPSKFQLPPTKKLQFPMMKMDHRPLVTISRLSTQNDKFSSNDTWAASKPTNDEMQQVFSRLRNGILIKNSFTNQDVKVVESYRSNDHGTILSVIIKNKSRGSYFSQIPYWFYLTKDSTVKFLGNGMQLINIADIDQDGRNEFIFMYSDPESPDQNTNGYILFYDDFKQSARFVWNNH